MSEYVEIGGLRWGQSFVRSANVSWPFAKILISPERVHVTMKFWKIWDLVFNFERNELQAIRKVRGFFNVGAQLEHRNTEYPPFILFWTFRQKALLGEFRRMGYEVPDSEV